MRITQGFILLHRVCSTVNDPLLWELVSSFEEVNKRNGNIDEWLGSSLTSLYSEIEE